MKLAATLGHFLTWLCFIWLNVDFMWPWLWKRLYGLPTCFYLFLCFFSIFFFLLFFFGPWWSSFSNPTPSWWQDWPWAISPCFLLALPGFSIVELSVASLCNEGWLFSDDGFCLASPIGLLVTCGRQVYYIILYRIPTRYNACWWCMQIKDRWWVLYAQAAEKAM